MDHIDRAVRRTFVWTVGAVLAALTAVAFHEALGLDRLDAFFRALILGLWIVYGQFVWALVAQARINRKYPP